MTIKRFWNFLEQIGLDDFEMHRFSTRMHIRMRSPFNHQVITKHKFMIHNRITTISVMICRTFLTHSTRLSPIAGNPERRGLSLFLQILQNSIHSTGSWSPFRWEFLKLNSMRFSWFSYDLKWSSQLNRDKLAHNLWNSHPNTPKFLRGTTKAD